MSAAPETTPPHRYLELPLVGDHFGPSAGTRATLTCKAVSFTVDIATGVIAPQSGRFERQTLRAPFTTCGDLTITTEKTSRGPRAIVRAPNGAPIELDGAPIDLVRTGKLIVAVLDHPTRGPECVAFLLGSTARLRLPVQHVAPITASAGVVACEGKGVVHVFREDGDRVSSITVPLPAATRVDVSLVAGQLCVLADQRLVILELAALPWGAGHQSVAIDLVGARGPGVKLTEPARVVTAMPSKLAVNHPKLGRLTLNIPPAGPTVARGGEVMIDDVREELPGIHRVYAWHTGAAAPCVTPLPEAISLAAPAVRALDQGSLEAATEAPASPTAAERVMKLAARHGFIISPLLVRVLEARERDPALASWLDLLGLELGGPGSMIEDWDCDPSLLELSQLGNGDAYCLYVHAPWCREGREPVVVTFLHETNFVDFEAWSFADFLERRLAAPDSDARIAALVRERLALAPREIAPAMAPAWLPLDSSWGHGRPPTREQWLALERSGDVLGAERAALHCYLARGAESAGARADLRRMYAALGWGFALENLGAR